MFLLSLAGPNVIAANSTVNLARHTRDVNNRALPVLRDKITQLRFHEIPHAALILLPLLFFDRRVFAGRDYLSAGLQR